MLTQERLMELFQHYISEGELAIDAIFHVGTYLYWYEIDIVNDGNETELVNCWRMCEWWGKTSPSLLQN